jgi:hypothetical protein
VRLSNKDGLIYESLKPGWLALWGSAAWEQNQLTPGVSTHAAPLHLAMCAGDRTQMTTSYTVLLLGVITGWGALLLSLVLLFRNPLFAVPAFLRLWHYCWPQSQGFAKQLIEKVAN